MENNSHDKNRTSYTKEITNKRQNLITMKKKKKIGKVILDHQYIQLNITYRTISTTHSS